MPQHRLHTRRQAVVITEDRLVVVRHNLQYPRRTLYTRLGLFYLKMKEGRPHPDRWQIRPQLLRLLETVACLFLLPVLQQRFPKVAPPVRRSRLLPQRFNRGQTGISGAFCREFAVCPRFSPAQSPPPSPASLPPDR